MSVVDANFLYDTPHLHPFHRLLFKLTLTFIEIYFRVRFGFLQFLGFQQHEEVCAVHVPEM